MDAPEAPAPPDPYATAQAQGAMNKETAIAQSQLNMVGQKTPQGSLEYKQIGTWEDGTPRFEATTTLSPEQQGLYDLGTKTQANLGQIGVEQSGKIRELLATPVNLSNEATEARLMELGQKRLDPALARRRTSTEQDLLNRGVRPGTEAYDRAMEAVTQGENDAYNQLLLSGRGQAVQEGLTERNQPINEITALLSGSQVSQPNFIPTPQSNVAPTDLMGAVYNSYAGEVANANRASQSQNAMLGGLFGLGGAALGGWARGGFPIPSDRRLKTDIKRVGTTDSGLPVYTYRYTAGGPIQMGVMADEVRGVIPGAVMTMPNGFDAVDYGQI